MPVTHREVLTNFIGQKQNKHYNRVQWCSNGDLRAEGTTLYTFDMPLAIHLGHREDKDGHRVPYLLKNADRVSRRSNGHLSDVLRVAPSGPTVSFSALMFAGLFGEGWSDPAASRWRGTTEVTGKRLPRPDVSDFDPGQILDAREDLWYPCYRHADGKITTDKNHASTFLKPDTGMFVLDADEGYVGPGNWVVFGAMLLRRSDGIYDYLCHRDENTYRVAQLPDCASTVAEACELLKPPAVRQCELEGRRTVIRQGCFYFVPSGLDDDAMAARFGVTKTQLLNPGGGCSAMGALMNPFPGGDYVCRWVERDGVCYATRTVRHQQDGKSTGDYWVVSLGEEWYAAHPCRAMHVFFAPRGLARGD